MLSQKVSTWSNLTILGIALATTVQAVSSRARRGTSVVLPLISSSVLDEAGPVRSVL